MFCRNCPEVPVVSDDLARFIVSRLSEFERHTVAQRALKWLVTAHPGLEVYLGITGRSYTKAEMDLIGAEAEVASNLSCPFVSSEGHCTLHVHWPMLWDDRARAPYGWLPTMLGRHLMPNDMRAMARHIADVKLALLTRQEGFWGRERIGEIDPEAESLVLH